MMIEWIDLTAQEHRWACPLCTGPYDLPAIESQLVALVRRRVRAYQLQDLKCLKCRTVSSGC